MSETNEQNDQIEFEAGEAEQDISKPAKADKKNRHGASSSAQSASKLKKIRVTIEEDETGPIHTFMNQLKDRGVKNPDIASLLLNALKSQPKEWWDSQLDAETPLEWKVQAALENPEMRDKLVNLLQEGAK